MNRTYNKSSISFINQNAHQSNFKLSDEENKSNFGNNQQQQDSLILKKKNAKQTGDSDDTPKSQQKNNQIQQQSQQFIKQQQLFRITSQKINSNSHSKSNTPNPVSKETPTTIDNFDSLNQIDTQLSTDKYQNLSNINKQFQQKIFAEEEVYNKHVSTHKNRIIISAKSINENQKDQKENGVSHKQIKSEFSKDQIQSISAHSDTNQSDPQSKQITQNQQLNKQAQHNSNSNQESERQQDNEQNQEEKQFNQQQNDLQEENKYNNEKLAPYKQDIFECKNIDNQQNNEENQNKQKIIDQEIQQIHELQHNLGEQSNQEKIDIQTQDNIQEKTEEKQANQTNHQYNKQKNQDNNEHNQFKLKIQQISVCNDHEPLNDQLQQNQDDSQLAIGKPPIIITLPDNEVDNQNEEQDHCQSKSSSRNKDLYKDLRLHVSFAPNDESPKQLSEKQLHQQPTPPKFQSIADQKQILDQQNELEKIQQISQELMANSNKNNVINEGQETLISNNQATSQNKKQEHESQEQDLENNIKSQKQDQADHQQQNQTNTNDSNINNIHEQQQKSLNLKKIVTKQQQDNTNSNNNETSPISPLRKSKSQKIKSNINKMQSPSKMNQSKFRPKKNYFKEDFKYDKSQSNIYGDGEQKLQDLIDFQQKSISYKKFLINRQQIEEQDAEQQKREFPDTQIQKNMKIIFRKINQFFKSKYTSKLEVQKEDLKDKEEASAIKANTKLEVQNTINLEQKLIELAQLGTSSSPKDDTTINKLVNDLQTPNSNFSSRCEFFRSEVQKNTKRFIININPPIEEQAIKEEENDEVISIQKNGKQHKTSGNSGGNQQQQQSNSPLIQGKQQVSYEFHVEKDIKSNNIEVKEEGDANNNDNLNLDFFQISDDEEQKIPKTQSLHKQSSKVSNYSQEDGGSNGSFNNDKIVIDGLFNQQNSWRFVKKYILEYLDKISDSKFIRQTTQLDAILKNVWQQTQKLEQTDITYQTLDTFLLSSISGIQEKSNNEIIINGVHKSKQFFFQPFFEIQNDQQQYQHNFLMDLVDVSMEIKDGLEDTSADEKKSSQQQINEQMQEEILGDNDPDLFNKEMFIYDEQMYENNQEMWQKKLLKGFLEPINIADKVEAFSLNKECILPVMSSLEQETAKELLLFDQKNLFDDKIICILRSNTIGDKYRRIGRLMNQLDQQTKFQDVKNIYNEYNNLIQGEYEDELLIDNFIEQYEIMDQKKDDESKKLQSSQSFQSQKYLGGQYKKQIVSPSQMQSTQCTTQPPNSNNQLQSSQQQSAQAQNDKQEDDSQSNKTTNQTITHQNTKVSQQFTLKSTQSIKENEFASKLLNDKAEDQKKENKLISMKSERLLINLPKANSQKGRCSVQSEKEHKDIITMMRSQNNNSNYEPDQQQQPVKFHRKSYRNQTNTSNHRKDTYLEIPMDTNTNQLTNSNSIKDEEGTEKKEEDKEKSGENEKRKLSASSIVFSINKAAEQNHTMDRNSLLMRTNYITINKKKFLSPTEHVFYAIQENKVYEIEELFITHPNISIESRDQNGNTFLILSAQCGNLELINLLVSKGANINASNYDGNTALHMALAYAYYEVADKLISNGAFQNTRNINGKTPWDLARQSDED